jgi:hypothetical protein
MLRLLQHPGLLVLLCFSLIGTPVTYRGGATNPHPHMFLEFLIDAEAGSFDHHHGAGHEAPESKVDAHAHHAEHDSTPAQEPQAAQQAEAAEQFGPSLSAFVVSDVGQLAFILPEHALPQASQIRTAFLSTGDAASGITHSPVAPPPR